MLPILLVVVIAVVLAIVAYQLIINKYYWGPKGRPKNDKNDPNQT